MIFMSDVIRLLFLFMFSSAFFVTTTFNLLSAQELPRCVDHSLSIELVAAEPSIVTPVSCRFDSKGRLFVIESHTHFPPDNYDGPKHDRIKLFDDPDGDGKLDRVRVFYEGTIKSMSLAIGRDDSIYVATRSAILRLRDTNNDDIADDVKTIVALDTVAEYPHNGLSGLLLEEPVGRSPTLTFGLGENFGEKYTLRGSDGSLQAGQGEGGNIFQCTPEGAEIQRVATGFWNPFGICRDDAGRLLMVDNDADAMPPCRIVHVVPKADYGFQFRFGRAGTHPLQAWNGELPGTLPMLAGTGEAPCAILCHQGQYWVTSWGDNRIERYTPKRTGAATVTSTRQDAVVGNATFRPVDMAIGPDGSMYVTDWVDRSYNVHRKGRIWKIRLREQAPEALTKLSDGMQPSLAESDIVAFAKLNPKIVQQTLAGENTDPFLSHALTTHPGRDEWIRESEINEIDSPVLRKATLFDARWKLLSGDKDAPSPSQMRSIIETAIADKDESVRMVAVRLAAEAGDKSILPAVREQLASETISTRFLSMIAAAISYLEAGKVEKGGFDALTRKTLIAIAEDTSRSSRIRKMATLLVPPNAPQWNAKSLVSMARSVDENLARTAARHLATALDKDSTRDAVNELLENPSLDSAVKADLAIARLEPSSTTSVQLKIQLAEPPPKQPPVDDLDAWLSRVGDGGDPANGWRVFFSNSKGQCASCHMRDGRGANVGPDLTSIRTIATDRRRLLDSILHPSREIGPMYTTWKVLTKDDRVIVGLKLNGGGVGQSARYLLADSTTVDVPMQDIEEQELSENSIMPSGLLQKLTIDEVRDLLAFLSSDPE
jgi:putative membrane-bound dehydrogenase-like protein